MLAFFRRFVDAARGVVDFVGGAVDKIASVRHVLPGGPQVVRLPRGASVFPARDVSPIDYGRSLMDRPTVIVKTFLDRRQIGEAVGEYAPIARRAGSCRRNLPGYAGGRVLRTARDRAHVRVARPLAHTRRALDRALSKGMRAVMATGETRAALVETREAWGRAYDGQAPTPADRAVVVLAEALVKIEPQIEP